MAGRKWSELTDKQRALLLVAASVQVSLAVSAWADLADRPASEVNGSKARWAAIIAVNVVGPLSYFRWGRKR
jgi:hypothetical protein